MLLMSAISTAKTKGILHAILSFARENLQLLGIVGMIIIFAANEPHFLTFSNVMTITQQIAILAVVAVGGALVILTGNIDLSVGSLVGLTSLVLALVMAATGSVLLAVTAALCTGIIVGTD